MKATNILKLATSLFAMTSVLLSCSSDEPTTENRDNLLYKIPMSVTQQDLMNKSNENGLRVWDNLVKESDENQILSPFSIQIAISILANGADEEIQNEITSFYVNNPGDDAVQQLNDLCKYLMAELPKVDNKVNLSMANSVWVYNTKKTSDLFSSTISDYFDAPVYSFGNDFANNLERVNEWCSIKTNGMIPKFLDNWPGGYCLIFNANYFNAPWFLPFTESNTTVKKFNNIDGTESNVQMMRNHLGSQSYIATDNYEATQLMYGNGGYEMVLIHPFKGKNVMSSDIMKAIETLNTPGKLYNLNIEMPKFSITSCSEKDLLDALKEAGLKKTFAANTNYPNIFADGEQCEMKSIVQKNVIKVNEKGTEAATVTMIGGVSANVENYELRDFILDSPFIYVIRETSTNAIIYIGRVNKM